ncbi:MAG: hypothetical protein KDK97_07165 [Verrucomicrobiales bacterium]|nr:hypothetical protein [Verrucomicrobiales bacterium]MCP5560229.1 hypothetical protein [Verrucomicrobiaceae bacterium]
MKKALYAIAIAGLAAGNISAQDSTQVKLDAKSIKLEQQQTPQIQASNIVDKKWRPKNWLEIDAEFAIKLARDVGGRDGSLAGLDVKYYVGMNQNSKDGKPIVLSGTVSYQNVPADDDSHTLAFVAPSTLKRILQKDNGGKGDVKAVGCEFLVGGTIIAVQSSTGSPWWYDPATKAPSDKFSFEDGAVLGKNKTPFAPFWGDYDVPVRAQ